jgi:LuxR family maltose regulon positive regulatory protein
MSEIATASPVPGHEAVVHPRQTGLLRLVADGHTNGQIARRLGVTERTLRTHLENIYGRLQVSSRSGAVIRGFADRVA